VTTHIASLARLGGTRPLHGALALDALVCAVNGAAYVLAAGPLASAFGLPAGLLRGLGAFLLVYAALVWALARRPAPAVAGVYAVVAANVAWVAGSAALLVTDWHEPTLVGQVWIVLQAVAVAGIAAAQLALVRSRR
jgi:hypothetical protein